MNVITSFLVGSILKEKLFILSTESGIHWMDKKYLAL